MNATLGIFVAILIVTLAITYWAAKRTSTTSEFYAAGNQLTAAQASLLRATGAALRHFWDFLD